MASYVLTDGSNVVSLMPQYDIKLSGKKIQSSHRTLSGANYLYKWGYYDVTHLNVDMLSSSDMCVINSWWGANTPLRLYDMSSSVVVSAYITNATKPIDQYVPPYTTLFQGVIDLEGY